MTEQAVAAAVGVTAGSRLVSVFSRRNALLAVGGAVGASALTRVGSAAAAGSALQQGPTAGGTNRVQATGKSAINVVPLTIKGVAGQTADLTQWIDAGGIVVAAISSTGALRLRGATHILGASTGSSSTTSPVIHFKNQDDAGAEQWKWTIGPEIDTINNLPNNDFVIKRVNPDASTSTVVHLHEVTTWRSTMSFNWSPPPLAATAFSGPDYSTGIPTMVIRAGANQTGEILRIIASSGSTTASIGADSSLNVPAISVGRLDTTGSGALPLAGLRIHSPDAAVPSGLFLNARATNSGPDFQLRALESSYWGSNFFQIANSDASRTYLSIRQDSGYVGIGNISDMLAPLDIDGATVRLRQPQTPASATAGGYVGTITWDAQYVYVCVEPNTWKRVVLVPAA